VTVVTGLNHYLARQWLSARRIGGLCSQRVLIVGLEHQVADLVRHLRRAGYAGLSVVGACVAGGIEKVDVDGVPVQVVGSPTEVVEALNETRAHVVAVADHESLSRGGLRRLGWQLEGTGVDLLVAPSVIDVAGPRIAVRPVAGLPLLHVEEPHLTGITRVAKRACEQITAALVLLVLSPLLLAIAVAVRVTSRGPALFTQVRIGQGGNPFTLYKFRTMRTTAEDELIDLTDRNDVDGPLFKMRDDPRRTRVGRWLRRFSLDELPQLGNVLAGHMSIVGPRPPLPSEAEKYSAEVRRRLLVKPGITGLWQVSGRSDLAWPEATRLDLYYVENWSPGLDLVILAKTVSAVLRGRGAY
jgi:exopolysaccharide biosynthesis polyprenyl glycosylphosphotransferase